MDQLYQRYMRGQIYTYIGDILLAMNPFQRLPIYSEEASALPIDHVSRRDPGPTIVQTLTPVSSRCHQVSLKYRNRAKLDSPPHIFAVADSSYHSMLHQKRNQVGVSCLR